MISEYLTAKNDADRRRVLALDRHVEYAGMTLVKERVFARWRKSSSVYSTIGRFSEGVK